MLDFRTYTDPGVYIEAITPPVVFTAAIEPTILAIVGAAPSTRNAFESTNLVTGSPVELVTLGGNPATLNVKDRLLGTQYVSAAFASLDSAVDNSETAWTVSTYSNVITPATSFDALIGDEQVTVSVGPPGTAQSWTVARGVNSTTAAAHDAGQVLNTIETYSSTPSVEVAAFGAPISSTDDVFNVTELYGVQVIDTSTAVGYGAGDSFKLTYGGQETIAFVHGTNATATAIKNGLIALSTIGPNGVSVTGTTNTGPFTVKFLDPDVGVTALTVTTPVGYTGAFTVTRRGVANSTYLDVEGERMLVTAISGSAPQTVTVVRGVAGTTAGSHGAVNLYENSGSDYTVRIGAGVDGETLTADDTTLLSILDGARVSSGAAVNVALEATDAAQFGAGLFNDLGTIRDKYGDPLDSDGQILSELTLGAQLAFANGATQLVLIATNPDDSSPVQDAIAKLQFEQSINSIAVLSGSAADISYLRGHVNQMSEQGLLRRAFVGLNGLTSPSPNASDFITKAAQLNSERVSLVAPGQFNLDNGSGTSIVVAGYFAAAAVAGLQAGLGPAEPVTRKQVFGFVGVNDQNTIQDTILMQAGGVLVVYEDRFGRLIIKHGLTTNMASVYTREISIVTARDRLQDFIQETLDGGALIGSAITSETPNMVSAAVSSALEEGVAQGLIFDYGDVVFRFPTNNVTMMQVQFSYKPSLPLNYILVQFSIDTNVGTIEFQNINDSTST